MSLGKHHIRSFETLESRQMFAADLASAAGGAEVDPHVDWCDVQVMKVGNEQVDSFGQIVFECIEVDEAPPKLNEAFRAGQIKDCAVVQNFQEQDDPVFGGMGDGTWLSAQDSQLESIDKNPFIVYSFDVAMEHR